MSSTSFEQSHDRLGITLFVAFLLHAYVIYAVDFFEQMPETDVPIIRLEVTLARFPGDEVPAQYDYLGDQSQRGGGESEDANPPQERNPDAAPDEPGRADMPIDAAPAPNPNSLNMSRLVATSPEDQAMALDLDKLSDEPPSPDLLAKLELDVRMEMAKIQDELDYLDAVEAKRNVDSELGPAAVREAFEAQYLVGWRGRIEAQGNINYPREPRIKGLYGATDLEIVIRSDGALVAVQVIKSSGHAALDDAAVRLVSQAAPYPPFSAAMRRAGMEQMKFERRIDYSLGSGVTSRAGK